MKNSGFTLIELVAVIVLLGILAVVALPRFINLSGDARAVVIQTIAANLQTGINFALLKNEIAGGQDAPIDFNGNTVTFIGGLPTPSATEMRFLPVSYTHLTLPTILLV